MAAMKATGSWLGGASGLIAMGAAACGGEGNAARAAGALTPVAGAGSTTQNAELGAELPNAALPSSGTIDANGELLLDDLEDTDAVFAAGPVSGEWFTYSDGTSPITPPDHTGLGAVDGQAHVTGSGFSLWGAGLSAYFLSVDLTAFDAFRLRARGTGSIIIELATPATSPAGEGGTCVGTGCFGHFATSIVLGADYIEYDIPFATLAQPSWAQPAELALDGVISLNLVAKGSAAAPATIDLWVDNLALHAAPECLDSLESTPMKL
jgi:hypothetical protein